MSVTALAPRVAAAPADQKTIEQLQDQRADLVDQYVHVHPEGSNGWGVGVGVGLGALAAGVGVGAVLLANRGKGAMYQGFNLMFGMPMALGAGGAAGYFLGHRAGEMATRPSGQDAATQVAATREDLKAQIADVDEQLRIADGRRAQPLPQIEDAKVSLARVGGHAAAGLGLGLLATAGTVGGLEALKGGDRLIQGGPSFLAMFAAPALAAGTISYLDQRDEANGGSGSFLRAAGIGAAAMGAASLVPAMKGIPIVPRIVGSALAGAAVGSIVHMVSANSRD